MLEQQRQTVTGRSSGLTGTSQNSSLIVEVACDDRQTQLAVQGSDTVAEVRRAALAEMQILTTDPSKYVVIGAGRQPVRDQRTMDELLGEGQTLYFRLLPQVAFGMPREVFRYA